MEAKRRVKAEAYYKKASAVAKIRQQVGGARWQDWQAEITLTLPSPQVRKDAKVVKRIAPYQKIIESYGYA